MPTPLSAALELAATGLSCFPVAASKCPTTPHGLLDASTDPRALRKLWAQHPGPLVGVRTGTGSVDVLDLDTRAPTREWWSLKRINIPPTRTHRTRSGGLHLLFQHAPSLRCSTSKIARGVDVRADGGYIIWWPAAGLPVLRDIPPAPWPNWLLDLLKPAKPPPPRRVVIPDDLQVCRILACVTAAQPGERNCIAFWAACRFGEMAASGLLSEGDALALIVDAAMSTGLYIARRWRLRAAASSEGADMPRKKNLHLKLIDPAKLPVLVIHHNNPNVTARALALLIAQQTNIFRHQGEPARLDLDKDDEPKLVMLDWMDIVELGYELANPVKHTKDGPRGARIPHDVGKLALKKLQSTETTLRPLDGFCTMPLLLDDGTINAAHGYHEPTRLYCHRRPDISVPDRPTRADAEAALLQLRRAFRTLPYADAVTTTEQVMVGEQSIALQVVDLTKQAGRDESAFLTMLMTAVCRRSLTLAPALVVTSPKFSGAGTGKGLSIRAISIVATGTSAHVNSVGRGNEMEKGIVAALLQPDPIISLDNLNNVFLRSAALCTALTESPARLRPLGSSENREINSHAFIALNGNGLRIGEDLVRRTIMSELDAKMENPELRSFPGDLLTDIAEARPQLLGAILTIWRWGRQNADQLKRGLALGSFAQWAVWVRDALITLGCCDPVERVETTKANDADRLYTFGIFEAWEESFGDSVKTCTEARANEKVKEAIDGGQQLTRQKFASRLAGLIGVRLGGYVMESPNKAEKEQPGNKKKMRFVPYTYRLVPPQRREEPGMNAP